MNTTEPKIGVHFKLAIWKRTDDHLWRIEFRNNRGEAMLEKGADFDDTVERGFRHLAKSLKLEGLHNLHRGPMQPTN